MSVLQSSRMININVLLLINILVQFMRCAKSVEVNTIHHSYIGKLIVRNGPDNIQVELSKGFFLMDAV